MTCDRCGKHFDKGLGELNVGFVLAWNRLFQGYVCERCESELNGNLTDSGDV